jgi:hypothetical protein
MSDESNDDRNGRRDRLEKLIELLAQKRAECNKEFLRLLEAQARLDATMRRGF